MKLFIVFSSSRIWLQIHLGSVFCRKCSILCAAKLRIRMCLSLKGEWNFLWKQELNFSWSFTGGMSCSAPGLRAIKYSITPKPDFPLAPFSSLLFIFMIYIIDIFSLIYIYLYLCICIHTHIYIHLVFYRVSLEMGSRWSLKPHVREFILNSIWIVSVFVIFLIVVTSLAPQTSYSYFPPYKVSIARLEMVSHRWIDLGRWWGAALQAHQPDPWDDGFGTDHILCIYELPKPCEVYKNSVSKLNL